MPIAVASTLIILVALTGCTQLKFLPYKEQALTLQDLSRERTAQNQDVKLTNERFEKLWLAVQDGSIKDIITVNALVMTFGEPILIKITDYNGKQASQWLYRYALANQDPRRIYIYIDNGLILDWKAL